MNILVTGSEGYVGSVMTARLLQQGHRVFGFDIGYYDDCGFPDPHPSSYPFIRKDIRDASAEDVRGMDAICHLAALSNDPMGDINPRLTREINYDSTIRLATLARKNGVGKFIFASSCSVYGQTDGWADERSPLQPLTAYAQSKIDSEQELGRMSDSRFCPVYLRNATAYGYSPLLRFDLVVNNFVGWALTAGRIEIQSDGTPWRPLLHVEDMCRAFEAVLEEPDLERIRNQAFNVGRNEDNYRVKEIAEKVAAVLPASITIRGQPGGDARSYRVSFDKIRHALPGFKPHWTLDHGIRQLVERLQEKGLTPELFQSDRFIRLLHLKKLMGKGMLDGELRPV